MAILTFPTPTQLKNLLGPTDATDMATKKYVDDHGGAANTGNVTFSNANISTDLSNTDLTITGNITANVGIVANNNSWSFNADGNLVLPGNTLAIKYANGSVVSLANANYAAYVGNVINNSQPNITSVGALDTANVIGNLIVYGNANIQGGLSNINLSNTTTNNLVFYLANNQTGFNVDNSGIKVGNANNISFVYDYTNAAWRSDVALISNGNVRGGNLTTVGNITTASISVSGTSNLNSISNVKIANGSNGQVLMSTGSALTWVTPPSAATKYIASNGTSNIGIPSLSGNTVVSVGGNANILVVSTTNAIVTGNMIASSAVSNSEFVVTSHSSSPTKGGQVNFAYKGVTITGNGNSTWNMEVSDTSNNFLVYSQAANGNISNVLSFSSTNGILTLDSNGGNISMPGDATFLNTNILKNVTVSGNATSSTLNVNNTFSVNNTITSRVFESNASGTGRNFKVGDDAWIGDINVADTLRVAGQANARNGYIIFGDQPGLASLGRANTGPLTYDGTMQVSGDLLSNGAVYGNSFGMVLNSPTGSGEGAQITMAYAGVNGLTGESSSTWNLDVNSTNDLRFFRFDSSNSPYIAATVKEDANVTSRTPLVGKFAVKTTSPTINVDDLTFNILDDLTTFQLAVKTNTTVPGTKTPTIAFATLLAGSSGVQGKNDAGAFLLDRNTSISDQVNTSGVRVTSYVTNITTGKIYRVTLLMITYNTQAERCTFSLFAERML